MTNRIIHISRIELTCATTSKNFSKPQPEPDFIDATVQTSLAVTSGSIPLVEVFSDVEMCRYHITLEVTNADDLVAFLLSSSDAKAASRPEKWKNCVGLWPIR